MRKSKYPILYAVYPLIFLMTASGCSRDLQDDSAPPPYGGMEVKIATLMGLLQNAQRSIIPQSVGSYQAAQNLSSDVFSGFMGTESPFYGNSNNTTYNLMDNWVASDWVNRYTNVMNMTYMASKISDTESFLRDISAFIKIIRVSAMARLSEKIGPIIYSHYKESVEAKTVPYDFQDAIYPLFFADLEAAINTFKELKNSPVSSQMRKLDLAYTSGNYENWLRYANTLRLRLALRLAYIDPGLAKTQGEAAMDPANGGLLEDNSQNCYITLSVTHPLNILTSDWNDIRMGAPMETYLVGYNDPRLKKYFWAATDTDPAVFGKYKGIRTGIDIDTKSRYDDYSKLQLFTWNKMQLMVAAESWFLKAEAALRGWNYAGDARSNYEAGIDHSFEMYGLDGSSYKNDDSSLPAEYLDPHAVTAGQNDIVNGSPYLSTITIKWDDAATNDQKLERIITQKWIALFPDGEEAWTEYRRTGYPVLFPVVVNNSAGVIPTIPGVRRLPIPNVEFDTNAAAAEAAAASLGGPNSGATRLRWDVPDKHL